LPVIVLASHQSLLLMAGAATPGGNLGFNVSLKGTLKCRQEEPEIEPPALCFKGRPALAIEPQLCCQNSWSPYSRRRYVNDSVHGWLSTPVVLNLFSLMYPLWNTFTAKYSAGPSVSGLE